MVKVLIPLIIALTALVFVLYIIFNKRQKKWEDMSPEDQKKKKVMIFSGIVVFLTGILTAFFLGRKEKPDSD